MTFDAAALRPILLVAGLTTAISSGLGVWLGFLLHRNRWASVGAALPLALPPTIVAAYLVLPAFPWPAAVAAGVLAGAPFLLRGFRSAFDALDAGYVNAARGLGASETQVFWRVVLPLSYRPLAGAAALVFARTAAEFALTLWLASRLGQALP